MESGLGVMDYRVCSEASTNITSNRSKNYRKWKKECYEIEKYAAIHGSRAAERRKKIFDEENSEWEQSDNKYDVDSEHNIFDDIIIDDE